MTQNAQRFYHRPTAFRRRVYDPMIRFFILRTGWAGLDSESLRVLGVRGRRTGRWYFHPVGVCAYDGGRYLVSFYGDSEWARNVRAGMETTLQVGDNREPVQATELTGDVKETFMRYLVGRYPMIARVWLKVKPKQLTREDMDRLLDRYPVFRVEAA